ncbi:MAG: Nif3-like dinuclear metal center hexameric protein [Desulfobacterales bacterium]|nr:Nif3-like dinuclear metal center hexameric protein [Desulfobacterales bacterium]
MGATVGQIIKIMDQLAPPWLAEEWDNVGLQIGDPRLPVRRIWVALDPSPEVVKAACGKDVDLLITHHPLIFRPLKSIDFDTPAGSIIQIASQHQLAIFCAHTNLDIVRDGVNDVLAKRLGLKHLGILEPVKIGEPLKNGNLPLVGGEVGHGIGRIGSLAKTTSLKSLALMVKEKLKLEFAKVTGNPELKVARVAICSGSGSSLMQTFISSGAQVYISGDIRYHDARDAESVNRGIIDIGHFPSEHLMVGALAHQLEKTLTGEGIKTEVEPCAIETDPFIVL